MDVVIADTGCANIASVGFAIDRLGAQQIVSQDADVILKAKRVILPGVGSATTAMQNLKQRGLINILQNLKQPVLGICLGMQILFDQSQEGKVSGLGKIDGTIIDLDTKNLPSPHMGWNTLSPTKPDLILEGITDQDYAYFVHSYAAPLGDYTLASSTHGSQFSAIVRQGNFYGCQFHPERSGKTGARILENFLKVPA